MKEGDGLPEGEKRMATAVTDVLCVAVKPPRCGEVACLLLKAGRLLVQHPEWHLQDVNLNHYEDGMPFLRLFVYDEDDHTGDDTGHARRTRFIRHGV